MAITTAYLAAFLATLVFPGQQVGLNLFLVWSLIVVSGWSAARTDRQDGILILLSLLPASMVVVLTAPWVLWLQVLTAAAVCAVGVAGAIDWRGMLRPAGLLPRCPRGLVLMLAPVRAWASDRGARYGDGLIRTGGLIASVLVVFGGLLLSADAAFAAIAREWLVPQVGLSDVTVRVIVFLGALSLAGAFHSLARAREIAPLTVSSGEPPRSLAWPQLSDWKPALVVLNALFAAFVAVQITALFGGKSHVLATSGLTYAEYARQGFFQLVAVAVFTVIVVAMVVRSCRSDADRKWAKALLGVLCLLTIVILVSAAKRMDLYQETYGATRLRLTVDLIIWWLAAIFALLIGAGVRWSGLWLPRAAVGVSLSVMIAFGISSPDARIAEVNVDRFLESGEIDLGYLRGLSTDAVPALLELPEPQRSCAIAPILARAEDTSIWSFNLSREAALDVDVSLHDVECFQQTEPYAPLNGRD